MTQFEQRVSTGQFRRRTIPAKSINKNASCINILTHDIINPMLLKLKANFIALFFISSSIVLISYAHFGYQLYVDEKPHYNQIKNIENVFPSLEYKVESAPFLGFHYITSALRNIIQVKGLKELRIIVAIYAFLFGLLIVLLEKKAGSKTHWEQLLPFLFPIWFPFYGLIYTDILALLFLLASLYFIKNKKTSGIFAILTCLTRQNNIFWVLFLILREIDFKNFNLLKILKDFWLHLIAMALPILIIIYKKSAVLDDQASHPLFHFDLGNVWFYLLLSSLLLTPYLWTYVKEIPNYILKNKLKSIFISIATLALFYLTFKVTHPYNNDNLPFLYLRNTLLTLIQKDSLIKALSAYFILLHIFTLLQVKMNKKADYFFYPIGFVFLSTLWLIEQRYYFNLYLFLFFIIDRMPIKKNHKKVTFIYWLILSTLLVWGISKDYFFL